MSASSDYETVAAALLFLEANHRHQPTLDEVAGEVGLSPFHFQRLFTRWAGVSPKRFLQFLTLEDAKNRLRESEPVLQAAFASGLSGPARLHDLFVTVEGVTPGEFKARGMDVGLRWGIHPTPFGPALLATTSRGLCHLAFLATDTAAGKEEAVRSLEEAWPRADRVEASRETGALATSIFFPGNAPPPLKPLSLFLKGTNFQLKVWNALLRVPPGTLTTYGRLAAAIGRARAARAVGSAVGSNPIAFLIPCHRVIQRMGTFGGYRWGSVRKQALLGWEAARKASLERLCPLRKPMVVV